MNTNTPSTKDTEFRDEFSSATIISDRMNLHVTPIANSQKQSFITKNIGFLASTILRTSWAIQRYTNVILEQQNCLRAIITGIDDGILLMNNDGTVIIQNEIGKKYFRELCKCRASGEHCLIHETVRDIEKHNFSSLKRRMTFKGKIYELAFTQIPQHNHPHRISLRIRPLVHQNNARHSRLHPLFPIIREMAAAVAHEINNPLTPILGLSSPSHLDAADSHGQKREMDIIHRAGEKIAAVVRQLLTFDEAHRCAGKTLIQADSLMRDISNQIKHDFKDKKIRLKICITENPPTINTNEMYLKQILLYLVGYILENIVEDDHAPSVKLSACSKGPKVFFMIDYENADIGFPFHEYSSCLHEDRMDTFRDLKLLLAELFAEPMKIKIHHKKTEGFNRGRFTIELPNVARKTDPPHLLI